MNTHTIQHSTRCQRETFACAAENVRDNALEESWPGHLERFGKFWQRPARVWKEYEYYMADLSIFRDCECD